VSAGELVLIWLVLMVAAALVQGDTPKTMGSLLATANPFTLGVLLVVGVSFYGMIWTLGWIWTPFMHPPKPQNDF
jgi:hypothetical protein